jgi:Domain of unknown function (DUF4388)/Tetratricopeptide repeat
MAIEGSLRELTIHDVFQMLDLSRKTGTLRVTSESREHEGTVVFERGRVISASMRGSPAPLGQLLVRAGRLTEEDLARVRAMQAGGDARRLGEILLALELVGARELDRQVRLQVEAVVFDLMSWREGLFSFQERDIGAVAIDAPVHVSTESLLMEGARRFDEWSHIVDKVPSLTVVPVLATAPDDHATRLDLLPSEWEVLAAIDGVADLRGIAATLGRSDFEVAKVMYGLVSTGVVEVRDARRPAASGEGGAPPVDAAVELATARDALTAGRPDEALDAARRAIGAAPQNPEARLMAARALRRLRRYGEATDELQRAATAAPGLAEIHLELGYAALSRGDLRDAVASWEQFLREASAAAPGVDSVRQAIASATQLSAVLEAHAGV